MRKILLTTALLLGLALQPLKALDASISYATFKSESGSYVELYLHFAGSTVTFLPEGDSTMRAVLNVLILFRQDSQIVKFDKYRLNSPFFQSPADFVDLKRYSLPNGKYTLDITVEDNALAGNKANFSTDFTMDFPASGLSMSDIQLLASCKPVEAGSDNPMVKSGFCFEPLPYNFYGRNAEYLILYDEIYTDGPSPGQDYLLRYFIDNADTRDKEETLVTGYKRKAPDPVIPFLVQMDIRQLPSGNYNLILEVRSLKQELLSRKTTYFQRSNPYLAGSGATNPTDSASILQDEFVSRLSVDELEYSLRAVAMQVDKQDGVLINELVKQKKEKAMKMYLFSYWARENPTNPEAAWQAYMDVARKIDEKFQSGFRHGFETDRGYVFMKYGAPSDVVSIETEPSAPPYEIWYYNQFPMTGQNNVRFLFYNPSLSTNGHVLLHSTARGEVNNPRWELDLYRNSPGEVDGSDQFLDATRMRENTGRQARRLFESY